METRRIVEGVELAAGQNQIFDLLITPSQIRQWWGASSAIVIPKQGGLWVALWGEEDHPDYVSAHLITDFQPPRRLELTELVYYARATTLSFEASFVVTFIVEPLEEGCRLAVLQDGFPNDPSADDFFEACTEGWTRTLAQIKEHVGG